MSFTCQYCNKSYTKESILISHLCEPKRRYNQRNEQGVQIGFNSYLRFYEKTQGSAKLKTYDDFCNSPFYIAFVRYGRYIVDIRAVNTKNFTDWLLLHNHKLDNWTKEKLYTAWLNEYIKKEPVQDAIERALKEMQLYADENPEQLPVFKDYFRLCNSNRICFHITTGRISPWIIFNCTSGIQWLDQVEQAHLDIILPWIDPTFWDKKFKDYIADTEWCKMILEKAGL